MLFELPFAPGDSLVLTAAVRDFVKKHGEEYDVSVVSHGQEVWQNNPHIVPSAPGVQRIPLALIKPTMQRHEVNRAEKLQPNHFIGAYHNVISQELALPPIELTVPRPELFIAPDEPTISIGRPYWVIFPGWKYDVPLKGWNPQNWQELVDILQTWGIHCVQVGRSNVYTPKLQGVTNLHGKTGLRQLYTLIRDSQGVICGVSQGIHIAAALEKPCVVLGGGREAWWWEAYTNHNPVFKNNPFKVPHRYLHTIGLLDCCKTHGCWKAKPVQDEKFSIKPHQLCKLPVERHGHVGGRCMDMITSRMVVDAVLSYHIDGTLASYSPELESLTRMMPTQLPPIGQPLEIIRPDGIKIRIDSGATIADEPRPAEIPVEPTFIATPRGPKIPIIDHPIIGGKVTLCVLTYGEYFDLHKQCIDAILSTTAREQVDIRVGGNQLGTLTTDYLWELEARGEIQHLNLSPQNRRKYPVMRELFRQPPISTNWTIWFDDDTLCNIDSEWLQKMLTIVVNNYDRGCRVVGPYYRYTGWSQRWDEFCRTGSWYSGREWPTHNGRIKPVFPTGSCWIGHTQTILDLDIPDPRIGHNKGDVTIGCQFWQGGWTLCDFSQKKDIVNWSSSPRRGITDSHPAEAKVCVA